eukprot:CAMPEP_0177310878 /NCGR_PEP_ID=MMETSP0368-20130122/10060_1 /TAXON_ID=447022 ORGANISM="Scrippsiella hangoei-like, Strain SHHI-4" /NCGR_SAMPLE_ID=MMETSP0368 /ASSEMBLY_ACC=CAM_ASM_000363 /LENGTH=157 /DNA_ID=CAMNT_0018769839 /DNA_START=284 /DNA_END=756 /DNA_ORIENTATION=-
MIGVALDEAVHVHQCDDVALQAAAKVGTQPLDVLGDGHAGHGAAVEVDVIACCWGARDTKCSKVAAKASTTRSSHSSTSPSSRGSPATRRRWHSSGSFGGAGAAGAFSQQASGAEVSAFVDATATGGVLTSDPKAAAAPPSYNEGGAGVPPSGRCCA